MRLYRGVILSDALHLADKQVRDDKTQSKRIDNRNDLQNELGKRLNN